MIYFPTSVKTSSLSSCAAHFFCLYFHLICHFIHIHTEFIVYIAQYFSINLYVFAVQIEMQEKKWMMMGECAATLTSVQMSSLSLFVLFILCKLELPTNKCRTDTVITGWFTATIAVYAAAIVVVDIIIIINIHRLRTSHEKQRGDKVRKVFQLTLILIYRYFMLINTNLVYTWWRSVCCYSRITRSINITDCQFAWKPTPDETLSLSLPPSSKVNDGELRL